MSGTVLELDCHRWNWAPGREAYRRRRRNNWRGHWNLCYWRSSFGVGPPVWHGRKMALHHVEGARSLQLNQKTRFYQLCTAKYLSEIRRVNRNHAEAVREWNWGTAGRPRTLTNTRRRAALKAVLSRELALVEEGPFGSGPRADTVLELDMD